MGFDPQLRSISPSASFYETFGVSATLTSWVWKVAASFLAPGMTLDRRCGQDEVCPPP